jgi:hypothetical protein
MIDSRRSLRYEGGVSTSTTLSADDRWALHDLVCRYFFAVDDHDAAALEQVFLPDSVADLGVPGAPPCANRQEIVDLIFSTVGGLDGGTAHLLGSSTAWARGTGATGRTQVTAHHVANGARYTLGCTYHDEFVRTPDGWRIAHRRLEVTWADGEPGVLA